MNRSGLPETAFVNPRGSNRKAVGELTDKALEQVLALLGNAGGRGEYRKR